MRLQRSFFQTLLAIAVFLFVSCTDYKEEEVPVSFGVDITQLEYGASSSTRSVTVSSGTKWDVSSMPSWVSLGAISRSGRSPYEWIANFSAVENDEYNREGKIMIKAGSDTAEITVTQEGEKGRYVAVESVSVSPTELTMLEGEVASLSYAITPSNASVKDVKWTTSVPSVAIVSQDGRVEAISEGTTLITAISEDGGKTASCSVSVMLRGNIIFADPIAKTVCVEKWDTNGDGELSYEEAASVQSLDRAFYSNRSLSSFDEFKYFTSIKQIKWFEFGDCTNLSSITIPENVSYIEPGSFVYCSLVRIDVSEKNSYYTSVEGILYNHSLTELVSFPQKKDVHHFEVPSSVTVIDDCAFYSCSLLESINLHDRITIMDGSFQLCTSLKSIRIPEGVTRIGDYTFGGCSSLSEIVFNSNLESIGASAFVDCISLTRINLPYGLSEIGDHAFSDCKSLQSVYLPSTLNSIYSGAFLRCVSLHSVTLQEGLQIIGGFMDCSALVSIVLPNSIKTVGDYAFYGCTSLSNIILPESITSIGTGAFGNCSSFTSIKVPSKVTSINDHTFGMCSSLIDISLPESVTSIGAGAFADCPNLASINIPSSVTFIAPNTFQNCSSLASVIIPEGVTEIGSGAFIDCSHLSSIILPETLTTIGSFAFYHCYRLPSIIIPRGVKSIGESAFSACAGLIDITALPSLPPWGGTDMFRNTNCPIYVPAESVDEYKAAQYWSDYANRIIAIGTPQAVDLGLSVKWASFNLGATKPEEYGDYYAWGENEPKDTYDWSSYKWCNGSSTALSKYCTNNRYGDVDNRVILEKADDVASKKLGDNWRIPTIEEWNELIDGCIIVWDSIDGINGYKVTSRINGCSIFLPAAGVMSESGLSLSETNAYFWSSSLYEDDPRWAWNIHASGELYFYKNNYPRSSGISIRPVYD